MFGHSTLAERPFGDAAVGSYDLTAKVFEFEVAEAQGHAVSLARTRRTNLNNINQAIAHLVKLSGPIRYSFGIAEVQSHTYNLTQRGGQRFAFPVVENNDVTTGFVIPNNGVRFSNDFTNNAWSAFCTGGTAAAPTITPNTTDVTDPFGGNAATKIVAGSGVTGTTTLQQLFTGVPLNGNFNVSFYLRRGTTNPITSIRLWVGDSAFSFFAWYTFNLATGSGESSSSNIGSSGIVGSYNPTGSWYRCAVAFSGAQNVTPNASIKIEATTTSGTVSTFYVYGAQIAPTSALQTYVETTNAAIGYPAPLMLRQRAATITIPETYEIVKNVGATVPSDTGLLSVSAPYEFPDEPVVWTNIGAVTSQDGSFATTTVSNGFTRSLAFNASALSIPPGATITGIQQTALVRSSDAATLVTFQMYDAGGYRGSWQYPIGTANSFVTIADDEVRAANTYYPGPYTGSYFATMQFLLYMRTYAAGITCDVDNWQVRVTYEVDGVAFEELTRIVVDRNLTTSINQTLVHSIALDVGTALKQMGPVSIAQIEAMTLAVARSRRVTLTQAEVEAVVVSVQRNRRSQFSVLGVETLNSAVRRNRLNTLPITQTETVSIALARLKGLALNLAETFDYQFSFAKVKLLAATISEAETFSFGSLRRTRRVAELINEVIQYAASVSRNRRTTFTVAQAEAITEAIRRVRQVQAQLTEAENITLAAGRRRAVQSTISSVEAVSVSLAKLKLMAFVSQQTGGDAYFLSRARGATVSIETLEDVQASFNRARALVSVNEQAQTFSFDFNRIRQQVMSISETQGVDVALNRLRELLQSISNTTDVQFNVEVFKGDPASLTVNVSWMTWRAERTELGATLRQVVNRESLLVPIRVLGNATVIEQQQATVVVDPDERVTLTVTESTSQAIVIPTNTL